MIETVATHTLNGIYYGGILFMIASGLSVIFGILGILNFAHGELYTVGAYTGITVMGFLFETIIGGSGNPLIIFAVFLVGAIVSALLLVPLGYVVEVGLLRRVYDRPEYYQLLLTFGILLAISGLVKFVWGPSPITAAEPYQAVNTIPLAELIGWSYPTYNLLVIAIATLTFVSMMLFFNYTKRGRIIRAAAIDKQMSSAIGVNTDRTFTVVFIIGTFLAGFGGALAAPPIAATLGMGVAPLIFAFVIIVIGGIGSIHGAFAASMIVGITSRWSIWLYPPAELAAPFLVMAIVLLLKPDGLFRSWGEFQ